ncbi:HAD family hydrolase [Nonomuraea sp. NPDC046570]|uniref:HAD family hydrolase n=1 Tax=Nonomuraea sp. NPDC046570 TaxID=3155255 RepID=UPI003410106C
MQRLALFDLDRTLIDLDAAFLLWAEEFAEEHGLGRRAVAHLIKLDRSAVPHRELFFTKVCERFDLPISAEKLWAVYRRRMPRLVQCYPGALDDLAALRADGWLVGIVTNGTADNQLGKIKHTGLLDVVDGYALSGAEGVRKPDTALFEIAAQRCGAGLSEGGWMVGDNLVADIGGGRAAGLRTIWINPAPRHSHEHQADHVAGSIEDAIRVIRHEAGP